MAPPPSSASTRTSIRCYNCNAFGHIAKFCPKAATSTTSHRLPPKDRIRRFTTKPLPDLNADSDNEWLAAFRDRSSAALKVQLPLGFNPFEKPGDTAQLEKIETDTHSYLLPRQGPSDNAITIKIWGEEAARAQKLLLQWAEDQHKINLNKSKWAKLAAYKGYEKEEALRKRLEREKMRRRFRQKLDLSKLMHMKFKHVIFLLFKESDWKLENVLGQQLEALDPIRMDSRCYIIHLRNREKPCFILAGHYLEKMNIAVYRLKSIERQIISRRLEPMMFFLIKPVPTPLDYSAKVIRKTGYAIPGYLGGSEQDDESVGVIMTMQPARSAHKFQFLNKEATATRSIDEFDTCGAVCMGARYTKRHNMQYLDLWLTSMLHHLPYYNGALKMRVQLGTCVFTKYKRSNNSEYDLASFERMLQERNVHNSELDAYPTKELGDPEVESELLQRFFASKDLGFSDAPFSNTYRDQPPHCAIAFNIKSPTASSGCLRLEVSFNENGRGDYLRAGYRWKRLGLNETKSTRMLDINLLDLMNSITSSNLCITASEVLNKAQEGKLPTLFARFVDKVEVNGQAAKDIGSGNLMFKFPSQRGESSIPLLSYEQRRSWVFNVANTGYTAELYTHQASQIINDGLRPCKERWGVEVYHTQWDALFLQNQNLAIGERTSWEPLEWQFFPPAGLIDHEDTEGMEFEAGIGYANMMRAISIVEKAVMSKLSPKKPENLITGSKGKQSKLQISSTPMTATMGHKVYKQLTQMSTSPTSVVEGSKGKQSIADTSMSPMNLAMISKGKEPITQTPSTSANVPTGPKEIQPAIQASSSSANLATKVTRKEPSIAPASSAYILTGSRRKQPSNALKVSVDVSPKVTEKQPSTAPTASVNAPIGPKANSYLCQYTNMPRRCRIPGCTFQHAYSVAPITSASGVTATNSVSVAPTLKSKQSITPTTDKSKIAHVAGTQVSPIELTMITKTTRQRTTNPGLGPEDLLMDYEPTQLPENNGLLDLLGDYERTMLSTYQPLIPTPRKATIPSISVSAPVPYDNDFDDGDSYVEDIVDKTGTTKAVNKPTNIQASIKSQGPWPTRTAPPVKQTAGPSKILSNTGGTPTTPSAVSKSIDIQDSTRQAHGLWLTGTPALEKHTASSSKVHCNNCNSNSSLSANLDALANLHHQQDRDQLRATV